MRYPSNLPVLSALALLLGPLVGQAPPPWTDAVAAAIEARREAGGIPAISVAIGVGDTIPFARGFGTADLENDVAATEQTVYRLASISKPVTAVVVMRLVEQGKLDLDRPVHEFVTAWPEKRWPVTTRQLLAHLGGVRHYKPGEGESTVRYRDQTAGLERFRDDPLVHQPGSAYRYSTFGFNLAAAAAEAAGGQSFPQLVQHLVAEPSGAATLQDDDPWRLVPHRAAGYVERGGRLGNSVLMDGSYKLGGGGLCCSAPDLVRFGQALLDGRLVSTATRDAMWTAQRTTGGERLTYGLGFRVGEHEGRREVMHSGAQSQVSTMFYLLPDQRVVIALLCNLEGERLAGLARKVAGLVVGS
ncbi:MAG: beta-lactamase family protein [Planctomycetes bacterium]|nr:beta-lactamase family protein [Planctomycetota bacterium]